MVHFPFAAQRNDFPILERKIQLSSCSQSALCSTVAESVSDYMTTWQECGMAWPEWMQVVDEAKLLFAKVINAEPDEIAVFSSVSQAASAVASTLQFDEERRQVVLTDLDFPTIGHVWLAQERRGATVKFIEPKNNEIPLSAYQDHVGAGTILTSISHQSYYNGSRQNLEAVAQRVHESGSLLFVDAYQSLGSVNVDVRRDAVDFLTCGMQKYMLGTPGIAFLYVRGELAQQLQPTHTGWFGQQNPFAFDLHELDYANSTRRFESGTPPVVNAYVARAAINYLLDIGIHQIEAYLQELAGWGIAEARERGFNVRTPQRTGAYGANIAIAVDQAQDVEAKLREAGIIVSARNDVIRIAPHFYNTSNDLENAFDVLADLID